MGLTVEGRNKIGIIMAAYNSYSKLGEFFVKALKSVRENCDERCETVIVDNNSKDNTVDIVRRELSSIKFKVIKLRKNAGLPYAYNAGAVYFKLKGEVPEFFFFMNDDVILGPNIIKRLIELMKQYKDMGAVQPMIVHRDGSLEMGFLLGYTGLVKAIKIERPRRILEGIVAGAAMLVRADLFFYTGMFDGSYFWGYDDVDFVWRLRRAGYKSAIVTDVQVYHYGSATMGKVSPIKDYLNVRNRLWMFFKNSGSGIAVFIYFLIAGIIVTIFLRLREGNIKPVIKIFSGVKDSIRYLKAYLGNSYRLADNSKPLKKLPTVSIEADALKISTGIKILLRMIRRGV